MKRIFICIIEDNESDLEQIKDQCSETEKELGIKMEIISYSSIKEFMKNINKKEPDLLIIDLRLGESTEDRSGWDSVNEVLSREIIPVIVYSAFAGEEPDKKFKNLIIKRVIKGEGEQFINVLKKFIQLKLRFNEEKERISDGFKGLTLQTLGKILEENNIEELEEDILVNIAVLRLASYLMNVPPRDEKKFLPQSIFIYPPLEITPFPRDSLFLGDILEKTENDSLNIIWLVVSPSCDIIFHEGRESKIKEVLLLRCYRKYSEVPFLKDENNVGRRKNELKLRLRRNSVKILKCPTQIFKSNYILVHFKDYITISYDEIKEGIRDGKWKKMTTLATPYAESLQNLFIGDLSRIGTPDTVSASGEEQWAGEFVR